MKLCALRWVLGLLLLWAGLPKAAHPELFAAQVAAYQAVPNRLIILTALVIPRLEVLAGLGLCLGFLARSCALVTSLLGVGFALVTSSALLRGLELDCGCFPVPMQLTWWHPLANLALAGLALLLLRHGPGRLALGK